MLDPSHDVTTPAETAYCTRCGLKHTRRPDWLCPRCGAPADTEPPPPPRPELAPPEPAGFPLGSTIAGALIAASGAGLVIAFARHPTSEHRWAIVAAALVLAVLGLELLLRVSPARWVVAVASVLGAAIASEGLLRERLPDLFRDPLPEPMRGFLRHAIRDLRPTTVLLLVAFDVGCLVLVAGRPRIARIAAGALLAVPLVVVELVLALGR